MAKGQAGVMELGGNMPDSLIDHVMLSAPEQNDSYDTFEDIEEVDEDKTDDNEEEAKVADRVEDEHDDDDEEPLKEAGGR